MAKEEQNGFGRRALLFGAIAVLLLFAVASYKSLGATLRRFALDFFYPYLSLKTLARDRVSDVSLLLYSKRELAARIEALREQNRILAAQGTAARSLAVQNEELRRLLRLDARPQWRYRTGEIILRDPLNWLGVFSINLGEKHGVRAGSGVFTVSNQGIPILVGVVRTAGKHSSQVITTYNPELRLSVELERSGASGIVNSDGKAFVEGLQSIDFLQLGRDYTVGDAVSTTGLESHIPPGLKIGNLVSVEAPESVFSNQMFVKALLRPAADLDTVRFVVVATRL